MTYTIFDHAQLGHVEPAEHQACRPAVKPLPVRKKKLKPRMRRKAKWYSNQGLRA